MRSYQRRPRSCSIAECGVAVFCRELCAMHYFRFRRHGNPHVALKYKPRRVG